MGSLLYLAVFLLVFRSGFADNGGTSVATAFISNELVPDILDSPPTVLVKVVYDDNTQACLGNDLPVLSVALQPRSVCWPARSDQYYTLAMVDPDATSRANPIFRELKHWLIVNILGSQFRRGTVMDSYLSPTPPPGTGPHRYTFLVYIQPGFINFEEPIVTTTSSLNRTNFSIRKFAARHNMKLFAGNFFTAETTSLSVI